MSSDGTKASAVTAEHSKDRPTRHTHRNITHANLRQKSLNQTTHCRVKRVAAELCMNC